MPVVSTKTQTVVIYVFSKLDWCRHVCVLFFQKASEFARKHRIPRIYLAANSGARIGLAEEIKHMFRVAWEDNNDPEKVRQLLNVSLCTIKV